MSTPADEKLLARAKQLLEELADFLTVHEETEPARTRRDSTVDRSAAFAAYAEASSRHGRSLQTEYAARFSGRVLAMVDAFASRGITTTESNMDRFELPTNPIGVRDVMTELGRMAETLELSL